MAMAVLLLLLLLLLSDASAKSFIESCNTAAQCSSMVAYRSPTSQSLDAIAALFNVDPVALLGANNLDLAAPPSIIPAQRIVKVPISCSCVDGIWRGNATLYKMKPGDTLSYVADHLFAKLVTYKQIAQANAIANYASVPAGTVLVIPFSCGCSNPFGGNQLGILLSYVVQPGDTVDEIVLEYGSRRAISCLSTPLAMRRSSRPETWWPFPFTLADPACDVVPTITALWWQMEVISLLLVIASNAAACQGVLHASV